MSINTDSRSPLLLMAVIFIFLLVSRSSSFQLSAFLVSFPAPREQQSGSQRARAPAARLVRHLTKIQSLDGHYREHVDNKTGIFDSVHV